jgi:hypothetical protein
MVKMTTADHFKYLKVALEVTRNYTSASGHGPMIENIYKTLCRLHQQVPDDGGETTGTPSQGPG